MERISTKKLDSVLSSQKPSNDKTGLGYTSDGSSSSGFENVEKSKVGIPIVEKKVISPRPKEKGKSLPKNQRDLM